MSVHKPDLLQAVRAWMAEDPDPDTVAELEALVAADNLPELADRFSGPLEFGTAGLRGLVGAGPNRMNRTVVRRTTLGLCQVVQERLGQASAQRGVVVGHDARRLSPELAEEVVRVVNGAGLRALVFEGNTPTPLCAFAARHLGAAAAVVVTASHNPPAYNGYKVYNDDGAQIVPPWDREVRQAADAAGPPAGIALAGPEAAGQARVTLGPEVTQAYVDEVTGERRHPELSRQWEGPPFRVAYTALHGVGGALCGRLLDTLGFVDFFPVAEQHEPDGRFPTVAFPNPEEPGAMDLVLALARAQRAQLVVANDPDADRLAVAVPVGDPGGDYRVLNGNEVGVLLGYYLLTQPHLSLQPRPLLMATLASSALMGQMARALGAAYEETLTGFKWIANRALELSRQDGVRFIMGYEEALGYCCGRAVRDKDGLSAALLFTEMAAWLHHGGRTVTGYLEEIYRRFGFYLSALRTITESGPGSADRLKALMDALRQDPPGQIGQGSGSEVVEVSDLLSGERRPKGGPVERLSYPASDVLVYRLADGSRITVRPSGTEPKVKFYFEVKQQARGDEAMSLVEQLAQERLDALVTSFMARVRP